MPKTIRDITDSNLEKNNEILIVFGINISNITGKSALANTETQAVQSVFNIIKMKNSRATCSQN